MTRVLSVLIAAATATALQASSTTTWEMNTFSDFSKGKLTELSLSRDGRLTLGPKLQVVFSSEQPSIWSLAQAPDGSLYAGTGHRGRVFRVDAHGAGSLLWTATEPEVFAVAVGPDGSIYAGTSPDGKIYRIDKNGKASMYFDPHARYIWGLAWGNDGALYVATGDEGKIWRVARSGAGEIWYATGQQHVTALAFDNEGRLLAGTEPNGLLYRITAKDKAFVLYNSSLPEIRTISVSPEGTVYAAALGGSIAQKTGAASTAGQNTSGATQVTAPTTSITVTDQSASTQGGLEIKPKPPVSDNQKGTATSTITPGATVYSAPAAETTGVEKSALYRINPDNTVETLWSSKEENLYDLLLAGGREIVFATDTQGRIYRLTPDRKLTLIVQTNGGETTRLLSSGESLLAATSSSGQLTRIGGGLAAQGVFESPVHDAGSVSKWGLLSWRGQQSGSGSLAFRARTGNSARPDRTWSPWSVPMTDPSGSRLAIPNARFVQWRAELKGDGTDSPSITGVTLSYLPQNNPPAIRSVNVLTQIVPSSSAAKASSQPSAAYTVTVTDSTDTAASSAAGTATQTVARGLAQQIQITWQADDPDGDKLSYSIYFRGEEEMQWKPLRTNIAENIITLEGDVLADGKYYFKVIASDKMSNPGGTARESEMETPPVLFDSTPPVVKASGQRVGAGAEITADASDTSSALRRAEYSLDASAWFPLDSADGVVDGQQEHFVLRLPNVSPAEHVVVIRVFDASNNSGLTKIVLSATAGQ